MRLVDVHGAVGGEAWCDRWLGVVFFFNDTATTEIYTLSLHDALPICAAAGQRRTTKLGMLIREVEGVNPP